MVKKLSFFSFIIVLFALIFTGLGCEEEQDSINSPSATVQLENAGSLQLSFNKTNALTATEDIDTVTATLTRSGYESVQENIAVGDGSASGTMYNVAEGTWHLTINAKDSIGTVLYSGNTEVEIVSDQTTYVTIELSAAATSGNLSINVTWEEGDGINWTVYDNNPVLDLGSSGEWDDVYITSPSVIYNGTTYEMWYAAYDGTNYRIGYASSSDGINWSKYSNNPVLDLGASNEWDYYNVSHPTVIYNGTSYEMWYNGYDGSYSYIGYASSSDGINWTKYSGNPIIKGNASWEANMVGHPNVLFDGTTYEMWYSASDGTNYRIGYATSSDGINWSTYSGNPILDLGADDSWDDLHVFAPNVILDGENYKMWYTGNDGTSYRIGYTASSDGINWSTYSGNPILDLGTDGSWNDIGILTPTVLYNGISYKMWFAGIDGTKYSIGYATCP
ncbi:MAG: hypothetical protein PVH88_06475 [Ignavibacteria bacterium]|jgi:predicted GH43/DUF377 family glycosyl hydrolase